ncbi:DNA gyrase inhibitor YacG [Sulfitobacter sp.]|uniref:DNA gyrase inhibitor YacG n=1 Tax=Sulfitobacter sp. TaxID=1903071 RepID=UPI0030021EED
MSCPICEGETAEKYRPFCSGRCADVDLSKWFSGAYATPSQDPDDLEKLVEALEKDPDQKPH